ncbi:MAG: hypothetical protein A2887_01945 [Alphaproteobacteria bacterium RIFCSPLOWO2_01_FULL_40_26]|nr:MAG: hypothetical protein A3D15_01310 [Alphaproteobacteria bacterium RIFCSPHIGHO2_02_FULL_40_34]OFW88830.1 MAG: hypothetical protein A2794_00500 [Alphaproteobacteria bacterium RIFCSPHIGHO2_01_FULL_40_8]OFW93956.1 MAG: hypothetical protein A2887_01945 [Alphaproteobacteria bacterium RIFCSPLOWO2_01_FULL_40_26]OFX09668.1 MAG: hypothetical protein A3H30_03300 [Alphaproteobacteria bacterium RIFCSPLOWO2_02_FULL_40_19]OFX11997.1 MAG: hypothetical protein A3G22_00750 [Alphaproteobacteria bacterium RI
MSKSETRQALKLVNITKNFFQAGQEIVVIKGVNLAINKGEMVALTGPSGSGKTTLLQIAGLLDLASSGQIFINDVNAAKASDSERTVMRKNHIGFVYQFHYLLPEFSALENVAMPLLIQQKNRTESFAAAEKILNEVELGSHLHHMPSQLSGGQQQRVALARAIVAKPSLVLADEPTGNLDSNLSEKIFTLLRDLTKKHEIGCLIVTHNLELSKKADRIVSIRDGVVC